MNEAVFLLVFGPESTPRTYCDFYFIQAANTLNLHSVSRQGSD